MIDERGRPQKVRPRPEIRAAPERRGPRRAKGRNSEVSKAHVDRTRTRLNTGMFELNHCLDITGGSNQGRTLRSPPSVSNGLVPAHDMAQERVRAARERVRCSSNVFTCGRARVLIVANLIAQRCAHCPEPLHLRGHLGRLGLSPRRTHGRRSVQARRCNARRRAGTRERERAADDGAPVDGPRPTPHTYPPYGRRPAAASP